MDALRADPAFDQALQTGIAAAISGVGKDDVRIITVTVAAAAPTASDVSTTATGGRRLADDWGITTSLGDPVAGASKAERTPLQVTYEVEYATAAAAQTAADTVVGTVSQSASSTEAIANRNNFASQVKV